MQAEPARFNIQGGPIAPVGGRQVDPNVAFTPFPQPRVTVETASISSSYQPPLYIPRVGQDSTWESHYECFAGEDYPDSEGNPVRVSVCLPIDLNAAGQQSATDNEKTDDGDNTKVGAGNGGSGKSMFDFKFGMGSFNLPVILYAVAGVVVWRVLR